MAENAIDVLAREEEEQSKAPSAPLVPVPIAPLTLTAPSVLAIVKARACDACELIVELKVAPPPPVVKVRLAP